MRKKFSSISLVVILALVFSLLSGTTSANAATLIQIFNTINIYSDAASAEAKTNPVGQYSAGTFYIYREYNGMYNITKNAGYPGGWINPAENVNNTKVPTGPKALLNDVTISSAPYRVNVALTLTSSPVDPSITEYSVDDMTSGSPVRIVDWNTNAVQKVTFATSGNKVFRLNSRNKNTAGAIEDSRTFAITVGGTTAPSNTPAYISNSSISASTIAVNAPMSITVTSSNAAAEFSVDDMTSGSSVRIVNWNTESVQKLTLTSSGKKLIRVNSRNKNTAGAIEDSRTYAVTVTAPISNEKAYLNTVTISPAPYEINNEILVTSNPVNASITEYSVDDMTSGSAVRIVDWNTNAVQKVTFATSGNKVFRLNSRNKNTAGAIEDSRTFAITVGGTTAPSNTPAYISNSSISASTIAVNAPMSITVTSSNAAAEFSVDDMTSGSSVRIVNWNTESVQKLTLTSSGKKLIRVNSRNKNTAGAIEDSRTFAVNVVNTSGYVNMWNATPTSYRTKFEYNDKNLYSEPSYSSSIIVDVPGGDIVDKIADVNSSFTKVSYRGKIGYIETASIEKTTQLTEVINPTTGNGKVIYLEAGHDYYNSGANSTVLGYTLYEGTVNWNVTVKTRDALKAKGYTVFTSKQQLNEYTEFYDNFYFANQAEVDLVISIHQNWAYDSSAHGTIAFYTTDQINTSKPGALAENKRLAEIAARHMGSYMGYGYIMDDVYNGGSFAVNRITDAPSILLECGFMTNYNDALRMSTDAGQSAMAEKIVLTIDEFFANVPNY